MVEEEEEAGVTVGVRRDGDGGEMAAVAAATVAAIGKSIETYELEMNQSKDDLQGLLDGVKATKARIKALRVEHNKVIALRLIDGEEVDGEGVIVMAREPLTVSGLVKAKVRCCMCRGKHSVWFNTETGEVLDAKEQTADVAAEDGGAEGDGAEDSGADDGGSAEDGGAAAPDAGGAASLSGGGAEPELKLTVTLNPFGIAMRAMQRPDTPVSGYVPRGGFHSSSSSGATDAADATRASGGSEAAPAVDASF